MKKKYKSDRFPNYDPSNNYPSFPSVITDNVYAFTTGYELRGQGNFRSTGGMETPSVRGVIKTAVAKRR